jgi:hypothetical protein
MPPALKPVGEKRYHVTPEQVAEMQELRKSDPGQWTIDRLAEKYECSTLFVRIVAVAISMEGALKCVYRFGEEQRLC